MLRWLLIFLLTAAGLLLAVAQGDVDTDVITALFDADSPSAEPVPVEIDQERYDEGVAIYLSSYCGTCHLLDAAGTYGNFGPAHNQSATDAATYIAGEDYTGDATTVEGYIRESIVNPKAYFTPGYAVSNHAMPAYTNLTEAQLDAVVYMLAQQC